MKKIYTLANMAKGMMLAALLAVGTTAHAQNVSGNTENGTVEGIIRKTICSTIVKRSDVFSKRNVFFLFPLHYKNNV